MASTLRFDNWENSNGDLINSFENPAIYRGKNLLYNGAMQVAQRGTSATVLANSYYTADRWATRFYGLGDWTQTVEADAPAGSGFANSLKMECTTANAAPEASAYCSIVQFLEGQDLQSVKKGTSAAEQLTLSFWVKSNVTGTCVVQVRDLDNGRQVAAQYNINVSGAWENKTITVPADTIGAFDNDNGASLRLNFGLGAGTDFTSGTLQTAWASQVTADLFVGQTNLAASTGNYFQITGVQLETGTVANNFDHKSYGVELAECQRYYQISNQNNMAVGNGFMTTATQGNILVNTATTMRAIPSISITDGALIANGASNSSLSLNAYGLRHSGVGVAVTAGASLTANHAASLQADVVELYAEI